MLISISEARNRFDDLIARVQTGDEVVFTQDGDKVARLVAETDSPPTQNRRALMERVQRAAATKQQTGTNAACSQDFLYGDDGLPA